MLVRLLPLITLLFLVAHSPALRPIPTARASHVVPAGSASARTGALDPAFHTYPNSVEGLESLMNDMLALARQSNNTALAPYFQSLVLPNAEAWFKSEFGDEHCGVAQMTANDCLGSRLALAYVNTAKTLPAAARMTMTDLLNEGLTSFEAVNYSAACAGPDRIVPDRKLVGDLTTTPILSPVLSELVRNSEPVYVLWSYNQHSETTIAFFVYSQGAFRYIGMPHPASLEEMVRQSVPAPKEPDDLTNEIVRAHRILANQELVQRTAVLHIIIGTDGRVREVSYVRGPEAFRNAAIEKVKEKRFHPMSLGGHPVQVSTCVDLTAPK